MGWATSPREWGVTRPASPWGPDRRLSVESSGVGRVSSSESGVDGVDKSRGPRGMQRSESEASVK